MLRNIHLKSSRTSALESTPRGFGICAASARMLLLRSLCHCISLVPASARKARDWVTSSLLIACRTCSGTTVAVEGIRACRLGLPMVPSMVIPTLLGTRLRYMCWLTGAADCLDGLDDVFDAVDVAGSDRRDISISVHISLASVLSWEGFAQAAFSFHRMVWIVSVETTPLDACLVQYGNSRRASSCLSEGRCGKSVLESVVGKARRFSFIRSLPRFWMTLL
ncbi:hypothetical protein HDK77DRAFT_298617 [Phyllosticta capitalensis]